MVAARATWNATDVAGKSLVDPHHDSGCQDEAKIALARTALQKGLAERGYAARSSTQLKPATSCEFGARRPPQDASPCGTLLKSKLGKKLDDRLAAFEDRLAALEDRVEALEAGVLLLGANTLRIEAGMASVHCARKLRELRDALRKFIGQLLEIPAANLSFYKLHFLQYVWHVLSEEDWQRVVRHIGQAAADFACLSIEGPATAIGQFYGTDSSACIAEKCLMLDVITHSDEPIRGGAEAAYQVLMGQSVKDAKEEIMAHYLEEAHKN